MEKKQVIEVLGNNRVGLTARRLGISRQAFHKWPATLTQVQEDRVRGALLRLQRSQQDMLD